MNAQHAIVEKLSFAYIETTVEPGVTLAEYRASRPRQPRRRLRLSDLFRLSGRRPLAAQ